MSLQQQFYGVAQPIVNQTNAGVDSLSGSISGGGGGGANPSVSTLTLAPGGQINLPASASAVGTLNFEYNSTLKLGSQIAFQVAPGPAGFIGMNYDAPTSSIVTSYSPEVAPFIAGPGGHSMDFANISSLTVSSINGQVPGSSGPKMNWGAINTNAGGSTIASVADNPYSGPYYVQLTYRGATLGNVSTLFASTINGNQFAIYGEPSQQVMYMTIGDN